MRWFFRWSFHQCLSIISDSFKLTKKNRQNLYDFLCRCFRAALEGDGAWFPSTLSTHVRPHLYVKKGIIHRFVPILARALLAWQTGTGKHCPSFLERAAPVLVHSIQLSVPIGRWVLNVCRRASGKLETIRWCTREALRQIEVNVDGGHNLHSSFNQGT